MVSFSYMKGRVCMRKLLFMLAGCAFFAIPGFCEAEITAVNCTPRYPWNGKVDVDVTLANTEVDAEYVVSLALVRTDGSEKGIVTLDTEPVVKGNGVHTLVWDAATDYPNTRLADVAVKATIAKYDGSQGVYLVFDLSEGKDAKSYPHRYTLQAPDLSSDVCRTTELWMRRVPAGEFTEGNTVAGNGDRGSLPPHAVRLTKPYYLGVFEMTQQQYFLLTGSWPSFFTAECETRPVETVSFIDFRGNHNGWYDDTALPSTYPLYKLCDRTGFRFDFPTEAQWERAFRAGVTAKYHLPEMTDANAKDYSRNADQRQASTVTEGTVLPDVGGTQKVGMFPANPWGFYDMAGNLQEICGDGNPYTSNALTPSPEEFPAHFAGAPYVDIRGPTLEWAKLTGAETTEYTSSCTTRGGSWQHSPNGGTTYWRDGVGRGGGRGNTIGFRLCITCK